MCTFYIQNVSSRIIRITYKMCYFNGFETVSVNSTQNSQNNTITIRPISTRQKCNTDISTRIDFNMNTKWFLSYSTHEMKGQWIAAKCRSVLGYKIVISTVKFSLRTAEYVFSLPIIELRESLSLRTSSTNWITLKL